MRKLITEEQVERTYRSVFDCLDRCQSVHRLWAAVYNDDEVRKAPSWGKETEGRVAALVTGMRELRSQHLVLAEGLQAFEWELPSLLGTAVRDSGITASSWTLGVVRLAEGLSEDFDQWERLGDLEDKERRDLVNRLMHLTADFGHSPDWALFRANTEVEASKMRDRARASSPEVRYAYEFLKLKPQSRKLFSLLVRSQGRPVGYEEIAEGLFGDRTASNGRIQTAVYRLRMELENFGSKETADAIQSEDGSYRFR